MRSQIRTKRSKQISNESEPLGDISGGAGGLEESIWLEDSDALVFSSGTLLRYHDLPLKFAQSKQSGEARKE